MAADCEICSWGYISGKDKRFFYSEASMPHLGLLKSPSECVRSVHSLAGREADQQSRDQESCISIIILHGVVFELLII
jgi:hypothetical protein